jgi:hypothetical protein
MRDLAERIDQIRARRREAASEFEAAGKERRAAREAAARLAAEARDDAASGEARDEFFKNRDTLTQLRERLASFVPASRRRRDDERL